jgi:peptidoglycan/LPS O-acetylase OafA/YrhL
MALAGAATGIRARPLTSTVPAASPRSYRPDIDGLRAIAILSVVLNHAGIPLVTGGFTGVDIFFVISGYLIGGHIYAELRAGEFSFLRFYQRRAKRILPVFFAVLIFVLAAAVALLSPADLAKLARSAFAAALSGSNIVFWHGANYFDTRSELNPLLMTWSLGVEEQFYAVIPLLMVLLGRIRRASTLPAILALSALSFLLSWSVLGSYPALVFYMLPARAWELGIGVALAIAELDPKRGLVPAAARQVLSFAGLALMGFPLFLLNSTSAFPGPAAVPSVLGAALAIAAPESWINRRMLSLAPLVFIGKVSYSWYLWHWPLLAFLHILYGGELPAAMAILAIALSFATAVLSYYLVEQPFRRSRRTPAPLLIRYAIVSAVMLAVCSAVWLSRGIPQRFSALAGMEAAGAPLSSDPCLADDGSDRPNLSAQCYDASDVRPAVALWGDSHAAALAPGLRAIASAQGYGFAEVAKASCPPATGATHYIPRHPRLAAECQRYNSDVLGLLRNDARIRIVILNGSWAGYLHRDWQDGWLIADPDHRNQILTPEATRALLAQSLADTVRSLQTASKQVVIFDDIPAFNFEPLWRVSTAQIPARRAIAAWLGVTDANDPGYAAPGDKAVAAAATSALQQAISGLPGVTLVDLRPSLCNAAGQCAYRDGSRLLYIDNNHISPQGATFALRNFHLPAIAGTPSPPSPESRR